MNRNDASELAALLEARVVAPRPDADGEQPTEDLYADAAHAGQPADTAMGENGYIPHVRSRKQEQTGKRRRRGHQARQ